MIRLKSLRFLWLWLVPLVLFGGLQATLTSIRSRQFAEAVNHWNIKQAVAYEKAGWPKDLETDLRLQILKENKVGVERLLAQGAEVNTQDGWSPPLYFAVGRGSAPIVRLLIKHGAQVNRTGKSDAYSPTPLMVAAGYRYADVVKTLIEAGANVNAKSAWGYTALDVARTADFSSPYYNHNFADNLMKTIQYLRQAGAVAGISKPLPFEKQLVFTR